MFIAMLFAYCLVVYLIAWATQDMSREHLSIFIPSTFVLWWGLGGA